MGVSLYRSKLAELGPHRESGTMTTLCRVRHIIVPDCMDPGGRPMRATLLYAYACMHACMAAAAARIQWPASRFWPWGCMCARVACAVPAGGSPGLRLRPVHLRRPTQPQR